MLQNELETAVVVARRAAAAIMEFYALEIVAEEKFGADNFAEPVTAADRAASKIIVTGLARTFPADAILSEEEIDDAANRTTGKRVWMIDPIDGTKGFINRDDDFGVQIGLTDGGAPILGVVLLPAENVLYYAVKGEGAFVVENDKPPQRLRVSDKIDFAAMNLAVSRNHRSPKMARIVTDFNFRQEVERGSVGLKVGLIAQQICDLYVHLSPRTKFWDTCAPQIILEEAGGRMTDVFGAPLYYDIKDVRNQNGILATNGAAHDEFVRRLKPLLREFGKRRVTAAKDVSV